MLVADISFEADYLDGTLIVLEKYKLITEEI